MQAIIHQWAFNGSFDQLVSLPRQELVNDWFGYDVEPSAEFTFATDGQYLWFLAARNRGSHRASGRPARPVSAGIVAV